MPKLTIRQRKGSEGKIMTGANCEVLLDGKSIPGLSSIEFNVKAKGLASVKMEMYAEIEIEGNIGKSWVIGKFEPTIKKVKDESKES